MRNTLLSLIIPVILVGCAKVIEVEAPQVQEGQPEGLDEVVFHAGWAPETKTVLQEDGSIWWEPGDKVGLFFTKFWEDEFGGGSVENCHLTLLSQNSENAPTTDLVANIGNLRVRYGIDSQDEIKPFYAIYPDNDYNRFYPDNSVQGQQSWIIYLTIPTVQTAVAGSFDRNAFVSVAETNDHNLLFRNLCGGIKFSVSQEGIKEVSFKYVGSNVPGLPSLPNMSGEFVLPYEKGEFPPMLSYGSLGKNEVIVRAPDNSYFEVGKYYYAVMAPTDQQYPLMITFKKDSSKAIYWTEGKASIERSVFKRLYNKDANLVFKPMKDEAVMMQMLPEYLRNVNAFNETIDKVTEVHFHPSSNHVTGDNLGTEDGPVYFELEGNEVHYYTPKESFNIKNVSSRMFAGWHSLTIVDLTGVDASEATDFWECFNETNLKTIDFSNFDTSSAMSMRGMFSQCKSLESLDLSSFNTEHVVDMAEMFYLCRNLRELDLSSFNTSHCLDMSWMFCYCISLQKLDLANFDVSAVNSSGYMSYLFATHRKNCVVRASEETRMLLCGETAEMPESSMEYFIKWIAPNEEFPPLTDPFADLYKSTDYRKDMTYTLVQSASKGKGIDIVVMGDAYSDRLINDGTYDRDLNNAIEQIFSEEPLKSLRDYFNVYVTYVVSENETVSGITALDLVFSGLAFHMIAGNGATIDDYMRATLPHYGQEALFGCPIPYTIVIANANLHAGVCEWYSSGSTTAYSALGLDDRDFHYIVCHEFGHAIGKLADEYDEHGKTFVDYDNFKQACAEGFYPNVDITNDPALVKWSRFLQDERYANQGLGVFEGGFTDYAYGIWRPTENSLMNSAPTGFNAPSREAIYKRVHELADDSFVYDYETFVAFDQPSWAAAPKQQYATRANSRRTMQKLPPPVFRKSVNNPNGASMTIH